MAQPTQCSGGSWAADKPVGSLERIPTTGQKQLRDKNGKSCHVRQYKRPYMCTVEGEEERKRQNKRYRKNKEKEERKKNRVNREQKKEYRKPKVMKNMSDRSKNMH